MQMTPEKREELLRGAVDHRGSGFADASSAPRHFADRIVEIRSALVEKRDVPQPSRDYQTRSMAAGHFVKQLFPTRNAKSMQQRFFDQHGYWPKTVHSAAPVRKTNAAPGPLSPANIRALARVGVSEATVEFMGQRSRANVLAAVIAKDSKAYERSREVATETMTADEVRREFEKVMGWK
jgi:hypothetical protein